MTIHYQLSIDDLRRINQERNSYTMRRFSDPMPRNVYWFLIIPLILVVVAVVSGSFFAAILAFGLSWAGGAVSSRWHQARFVRKYYSAENHSASLLPFQLELLPDRLVLSNANLVHQHFWHGFQGMRETPGYFHLFFSLVASTAVPKSAFASNEDLEAFRNEVRSHEPAVNG